LSSRLRHAGREQLQLKGQFWANGVDSLFVAEKCPLSDKE